MDYVQGVTSTLARHGVQVPGFDVRIESTIPLGAGVSSSAALEVSLLRGLRALLGLDLDDVTIARMAQAGVRLTIPVYPPAWNALASRAGHRW